jgi:hypothetical protein
MLARQATRKSAVNSPGTRLNVSAPSNGRAFSSVGLANTVAPVLSLQRAVGNRTVNLLIQRYASPPGRGVPSLEGWGRVTSAQSFLSHLGLVQRQSLQRKDPPPIEGQAPDVQGHCALGIDEGGHLSFQCDSGGDDSLKLPPDKNPFSRPPRGQPPVQLPGGPTGPPPGTSPTPDLSQACPGRFNPLTGMCCRDDQVFDTFHCACPPGQLEQSGVCAAPPASDASPGPGDYNAPDPNAPTQMG